MTTTPTAQEALERVAEEIERLDCAWITTVGASAIIRKHIAAHPQPVAVSGEWVMVPREPTEAMQAAGVDAAVNKARGEPWFPFAWRAALAASPHPEPAPPVDPFFGELERRAVVFPRKPSAPPEPESAAPVSNSNADSSATSAVLSGQAPNCEDSRTTGSLTAPDEAVEAAEKAYAFHAEFVDHGDCLRAALNAAFQSLTAQVAPLVAENAKLRESIRGALADEEYQATRAEAVEQQLAASEADAALGAAIQRAAGELPDGWQVVLEVELGSGGFTLYDAEGAGQEDDHFGDPGDCPLARRLNNAIDAARAATKEPT